MRWSNLSDIFETDTLMIGKESATLSEIIEALEAIYCGTLGIEYNYISSLAERPWFQKRLEPNLGKLNLRNAVIEPLKDFFSRFGLFMATMLLLIIATYRLTDLMMGPMANVFYIDMGFTLTEIGYKSDPRQPKVLQFVYTHLIIRFLSSSGSNVKRKVKTRP
mgnify:CR=1 FL=1